MEESIVQNHLEKDGDQTPGNFLEIATRLPQGVHVVDRRSLHPLQGENPAGRVLPVHLGNENPRVPGKVLAELAGVACLQVKIQLPVNGAGEFFHDPYRVDRLSFRDVTFQEFGDMEEDVNIGFQQTLDPGALDLDGHLLSAAQPSVVDLGNGSRCPGNLFKRGEDCLEPSSQLLLDNLPDLGEGERRDVVLELAKLHHELPGDQIGPGTQDLAELDKGGTQLFKSGPQALGDRVAADLPIWRLA